jgi:hypothetical protein
MTTFATPVFHTERKAAAARLSRNPAMNRSRLSIAQLTSAVSDKIVRRSRSRIARARLLRVILKEDAEGSECRAPDRKFKQREMAKAV